MSQNLTKTSAARLNKYYHSGLIKENEMVGQSKRKEYKKYI